MTDKKYYQSKSPMGLLALPIVLALISLGCGFSGALANLRSGGAEPGIPTRTPLPTFTPTPVGAAFVEVSAADLETAQAQAPAEVTEPEVGQPSPTPLPSPTPEPAGTPEPTEEPVTVTVLNNMNVRGGPGTNYPVIGAAPPGASSKVVGRNADSSWLQVEYPPGANSTGWVYAALTQVNGNPATVVVVEVAPPPQPVAAAQPPQEAAPPPPPTPSYQFTPAAWHASENAAICHFKGRIRDEAGNLINGYSVLVNNGSWSVISHPTGASRWYPEKGDGEWDVSGIELKDCIGWWTLTVVRYDCPDFFGAGFDAQCKQFTRLSEEIPVEVVYPTETVINADWVCHWDCDKGLYVQGYRRP